MRVETVIIGDEILLGDTVDTNSAYLGRILSKMGFDVCRRTTVKDSVEDIRSEVVQALKRSDVIVVTGGLGPTRDDVTRNVISEISGRELVFDKNSCRYIEGFFKKRGIKVPESVKKQAYIPRGAVVLRNTVGTAPGFYIKHNKKTIIVLPGPPGELMQVFRGAVPLLKKIKRKKTVLKHIIHTCGAGESFLEDMLKDFPDSEGLKIGFQAHPGHVDLRISAEANSTPEAKTLLDRYRTRIKKVLRGYVSITERYGLEETAARLLKAGNLSIALAESCTGGSLSDILTNIPGSSRYFKGGIIAYSNEIKRNVMGIRPQVLKNYGAVSRQVAAKMAENVRKLFFSDIGIGITGIAGPGGTTKTKSVGLVYIALSDRDRTSVHRFNFTGERMQIKKKASCAALNSLVNFLRNPQADV